MYKMNIGVSLFIVSAGAAILEGSGGLNALNIPKYLSCALVYITV